MTRMAWLALVLVACSGSEEDLYGPSTCDGGGEPILEAGVGGQLNFEAFGDGDLVPVRADGETIEVQLYTSGIDTTDTVTVVIKTSVGGGTTRDSINSFTLVCNDEEGQGWLGAYPFLPPDARDGDVVTLSATITDTSSVSVSTDVDLKLQF